MALRTGKHICNGLPIRKCRSCRLIVRNAQPSDEVLEKIHSEDYFLGEKSSKHQAAIAAMKKETAQRYLDYIE